MNWKEMLFGSNRERKQEEQDIPSPDTDESQPTGKDPSSTSSPPYVELSEEDITPIREVHRDLSSCQMDLGRLTMDYERKKQEILDKMDQLRQEMEERVGLLRQEHGIPDEDDNYTLNLPSGPDQKAAFIRDAQFDEESGDVLEVGSNQDEGDD